MKNPHDPGQAKSLPEMQEETDEAVRVMAAHLRELRTVQKALRPKLSRLGPASVEAGVARAVNAINAGAR